MTELVLTAEQIRYFRATRSFLTQRAPDAVTCARGLMGAQAQVHSCALHAIALRTQGNPTATALDEMIYEDHTLVRTWGQRDTLHLYDPTDLPMIIASRKLWTNTGRQGGMPSDELTQEMARWFEASGASQTRSSIIERVPQAYIDQLRDHKAAGDAPERFAASRLIWMLALRGEIVFAKKSGREQSYAHRTLWLPELEWALAEPGDAAAEATRRYLSVFGPSTVKDIAHHVGSTITACKSHVMPHLEGELVNVVCEDKKGLLAMARDVDDLTRSPESYPTRLLPAYDTMLMSHKDKRWILPDAQEEKLVWKKAAVVRASVIHEGQIVAVWQHKKTSKKVNISLEPLSGWRAAFLDDVARDAAHFASHLGLELGTLDVVT